MSNFRVSSNDIPSTLTIHLSETEKCIFADLLTRFLIPVNVAGDTFHHLYRRGLEKIYEKYEDDE